MVVAFVGALAKVNLEGSNDNCEAVIVNSKGEMTDGDRNLQ